MLAPAIHMFAGVGGLVPQSSTYHTALPHDHYPPSCPRLPASVTSQPCPGRIGVLRHPEAVDTMVQRAAVGVRGACALALDHVGHCANNREMTRSASARPFPGRRTASTSSGTAARWVSAGASKLTPAKNRVGFGPEEEC